MAAIFYSVGAEKRVILNDGANITEKQYNEMLTRYEKAGYSDRMSGYYDKWYFYYCSDDGAAYDKGVYKATLEKHCPSEYHIIDSTPIGKRR